MSTSRVEDLVDKHEQDDVSVSNSIKQDFDRHIEGFVQYLKGPLEGRNLPGARAEIISLFAKYLRHVLDNMDRTQCSANDLCKNGFISSFIPSDGSSMETRREKFAALMIKVELLYSYAYIIHTYILDTHKTQSERDVVMYLRL